ncbi:MULTISPECIES: NAD(P)/FAD-dependent oxidoreductase [Tissierellales]|jgi:hypothetical protein|uniref:NAD(P)/FAD-dependent oxidoreductase n=1 Tax=Acidilutibacter cellobiosedens TaxID=2507161 RepID=A0A410QD20_9FIRM|nr:MULTISPECIES: NAD(P)/FAD-dependent oxidoreductase [Tissierellales]MBE6082039.1 NAD(P)/FAD-dependent oxidoreductase [Tissierellaceae bacterium]QAT61718.1 NAD(P)/FAD-dependent oxidoreductase [Acidilutibacter cellobiosedens]SCL82572.1 dihydrolipoamide dehydrogenase [Sporanaerobacter sp. PP17-6a]
MAETVGVIGGGPAGIIAAGTAASNGRKVTLIEKNNKIGKKLYITGKGRCNITNSSPIEDFFDNIVTNYQFLYSALYSFTNTDILNLLSKYGLKVKVERGNRVFPLSDKSSDVIKTFEKFLKDNGVEILFNFEVRNISKKGNKFMIMGKNGEKLFFDKIIICTGGKSYPSTGSTGDGYNFAQNLGHRIIPLKPSLVPFETVESWVKDLQGLTLKNVRLSAYSDGKKIYEDFGEMLFTHFGISGPIVLTMSNYINKYDGKRIDLKIDLKPALSIDKLDERILRDFDLYKNKHISNGLKDLLPKKMIPIILRLSKIDEEKFINQITKEERNNIVDLIKSVPLTFKKFRPLEEAIVTSGGVSTLEINSSTMESKILKGLFFAGEIIDIDGLTGGYNLQIAYSTGYLAGKNC